MIGVEDGEYALRAGAYPQAFEIFMMLAGTGEDPAYYNLCSMVLNNQLNESQLQQLDDLLQREARNGDKLAIYNLGIVYWRSSHARFKNLDKAAECLQRASALEVPEANVALAKFYIGEGSTNPMAKPDVIAHLLEQALDLGVIEAAYLLGRIYYEGSLMPRNDSKAFIYLYIAAKQGHVEGKKALLLLQTLHDKNPFTPEIEKAREIMDQVELYRGGFRQARAT